mmetsp:Transcript_35285/g.82369  ORF Transcript_35285/g.82369 Transcript_35285/m.82369 type:complete len:490 (+) Transcript_35285:99-1568(+)
MADGAAAEDVMPALELQSNEPVIEKFTIFPSSQYQRRYMLDGDEHISWDCKVQDGYDVVLSTRVVREEPTKFEREVTERERCSEFTGYLDLVKDHAACVEGSSGQRSMLVLDFDNGYSFFTKKDIVLQLLKKKASPQRATPTASAVTPGSVKSASEASATDGTSSGSNAQPILELPEGDAPVETLVLGAAASYKRRYWLEGFERISWEIQVLDGYDLCFTSRLVAAGMQSGPERSKEVTERERASSFSGFIDVGMEHAGMLQELGGAAKDSSKRSGAVLVLDFDNTYSFFTKKNVQVKLTKLPGCEPKPRILKEALAACKASKEWERSLRLLRRMPHLRIEPDLEMYNTALQVQRAAGQWQSALQLLQDIRKAGLAPNADSWSIATSACEESGQAQHALMLLDEISRGEEEAAAAELDAAEREEQDVAWMRRILKEAISRCPPRARQLKTELTSAQKSLEKYAQVRAQETRAKAQEAVAWQFTPPLSQI